MIIFSRHARNNMRLYKIQEADIIETLEAPDREEQEGNRRVAIRKLSKSFGRFPLKVVCQETEEGTLVITAYPLKKKHWG